MSKGTGSTGGNGAGYRVEVDSLRAFASRVRGLLDEFQANADATRVHGASGVKAGAFGTFAEAEALHSKYEGMRDALRQVLDEIHSAIDEAQHKADLTATNYEEQEHETSRNMKIGSDGWSVATPAPSTPSSPSPAARPAATAAAPAAKSSPAAPASGGNPQPTW